MEGQGGKERRGGKVREREREGGVRGRWDEYSMTEHHLQGTQGQTHFQTVQKFL